MDQFQDTSQSSRSQAQGIPAAGRMRAHIQDAFSARELEPLLKKKRQSIEEWAARYGWRYLETPGRGRHGHVKLWLVASMDESTRIVLSLHAQRNALPIQPHQQPLPIASPLSSSFSSPSPSSISTPVPSPPSSPFSSPVSMALPELPPQKLRKAALRADLVRHYLDAKRLAKRRHTPLARARAAFVTLYNANASYPSIFSQLGPTSEKTLERWAVTLRQNGHDCAALASHHGEHRQGASKVTEAEKELLLKLLLHQNRIKIGTAIEMVKLHLATKNIPSPSSTGTLRNFINEFRSFHADVWTLAREGEKALVDKILPYFERDISLLEVGDVLVADGHRCNFTVNHPFTGKPIRPTLIAFLDWASRDIAGFAYMLQEDIQTIHLALYRAILRLGKPPKVVYLDNGKGFRAKAFTSLDLTQSGLAGLYARLGIQAVFAKPYNARSKVIEPFFKTFGDHFERFLPTFSGASPQDKPARLLRNEPFMQRLAPTTPLSLEQAALAFESWLDLTYRRRPHSGLNRRTPGDVFTQGRGPGVDPAELRTLMMHHEITHLTNNGIARFGNHYRHDALYGLRTRVVIRYDWHNLDSIHVYTLQGDYICEAIRTTPVHPMFALAGGRDTPAYAAFRHEKRAHEALKRATKRLVAQTAQMGQHDSLATFLPLPDSASPGDDDAAPQAPLLDPTSLDWMDPADLEAAVAGARGLRPPDPQQGSALHPAGG